MSTDHGSEELAISPLILDSFPNGAIVIFDLDLRFVAAGGRGLEPQGLSKEMLIGRTIYEAYDAETASLLEQVFRQTLVGEDVGFDVPYASRVWNVRISPIRDADGAVIAGMGVSQEVTEERESAEKFRLAMVHAPIGKALAALDGRFIEVNEALAELLGYTQDELHELSFRDVTHPDDLEADESLVDELTAGARLSYSIEKRYLRKDGSPVWVELHATLLRDQSGEPVHFISQIVDITDRKRMVAAEQRLLDQLHRSNEDLARFASIASHDLQAPLRTVGAFTDLLLASFDPATVTDQQREMAGHIQAGITRMRQLIGDLLDFSRLDSEPQEAAEVAVDEVVGRVLLMLASDIEQASATVTCQCADSVRAAPAQLERVMQDLTSNALVHRSPERSPVVHITSRRVDGRVEIAVADNGRGIAPGDQQKIFDMFTRLSSERAGSGIGLAVVKRIIEGSGGTIDVDSDGESGTTFRVTLPASS